MSQFILRHLIYFERLENLNFLLHTGSEGSGAAGEFLTEVLWHGFLDTLKLVPFLFLTYLLMEFIEHRAADKTRAFMKSAGKLGPLAGGALGAVPQCGFSAAAANLYTGRVISLGTLIAVFLSTSDEMLPILISGNVKLGTVLIKGKFSVCTVHRPERFEILLVNYRSKSYSLIGHIKGKARKYRNKRECRHRSGIIRSALNLVPRVSFLAVVSVTNSLNSPNTIL